MDLRDLCADLSQGDKYAILLKSKKTSMDSLPRNASMSNSIKYHSIQNTNKTGCISYETQPVSFKGTSLDQLICNNSTSKMSGVNGLILAPAPLDP